MERSKEEKEMREFSWPALFIVTGLSSAAFSFVLKFLQGAHSRIFLLIGLCSTLIGIVILLIKRTMKPPARKDPNL